MALRSWRFVTLLLAALALTMTSAHLLELPQKMGYSPELYAAVNTTMYRYFAIVGGAYTVGSILSAAVLAVLVRRRGPTFRWTVAGLAFLCLAFASWLALVAPVNQRIAAALERAPDTVPTVWQLLRDRWEYGHATGFVLQLVGFAALVVSLLVETPGRSEPHQADRGRAERTFAG
jgi:MFS family permease